MSNAVTNVLTSFFSNCGSEIAKGIGKDVYEKVKKMFKNDEERSALNRFEAEPFSAVNQDVFREMLVVQLIDKRFFQDISRGLNITTATTFILGQVTSAIIDIKSQLKLLYPCLINSGPDKYGEYQNRIDHLETQLVLMERKFFLTITPPDKKWLVQ